MVETVSASRRQSGQQERANDIRIVEFTNKDRKLLKKFVQFATRLYANDPNYVPPLNVDLLGSRLLGHIGLLTDKHPFHRHADVAYFLAYRGREIVGRVAGCVDRRHNANNKAQDVIFGFFECIEDLGVVRALLDRVVEWGKARDMTRLLGPMSFNTNHIIGVQLDAYDTLPYFETACNPPYYVDLMEAYGLDKAMDVLAQLLPLDNGAVYKDGLDHARKCAERARQKNNLTVRPVDIKNFESDMRICLDIYSEAWQENWGATALTDDEFRLMTNQLRSVVDPETILFAFIGDEPVGVLAFMPDYYDCIKPKHNLWDRFDLVRILRLLRNRHTTKRGRAVLGGVKKQFRHNGVKDVLLMEGLQRCVAKGQYDELEFSWILETNAVVLKITEGLKAKRYKTWRIYEKDLTN